MSVLRVYKPMKVMSIERDALERERLVYFLLANKKLKHQEGRSKIIYIGQTRNGIKRIAESAASNISVLQEHGVNTVQVYTVACKPRQNVNSWKKLERAMLLEFRSLYDDVPMYNTQGKNYTEQDEFRYFSRTRIRKILQDVG